MKFIFIVLVCVLALMSIIICPEFKVRKEIYSDCLFSLSKNIILRFRFITKLESDYPEEEQGLLERELMHQWFLEQTGVNLPVGGKDWGMMDCIFDERYAGVEIYGVYRDYVRRWQ